MKLFLLIILSLSASYLELLSEQYEYDYFNFPKAFPEYQYMFYAGASVTKLPMVVVEEEISQSPMLNLGFRIDFPFKISSALALNTNYIANYANVQVFRSFQINNHYLAIGGKFAMWFGHLEMEGIRLKSYGWIINPTIYYGYDFQDFLLSCEIESQHSRMFTYSEDEYLGSLKDPAAGIGIKFNLEQPLWNDNCVSISLKLNYSKFYYQSWLAFNTIDEYLFYPELIFGFVL